MTWKDIEKQAEEKFVNSGTEVKKILDLLGNTRYKDLRYFNTQYSPTDVFDFFKSQFKQAMEEMVKLDGEDDYMNWKSIFEQEMLDKLNKFFE